MDIVRRARLTSFQVPGRLSEALNVLLCQVPGMNDVKLDDGEPLLLYYYTGTPQQQKAPRHSSDVQ